MTRRKFALADQDDVIATHTRSSGPLPLCHPYLLESNAPQLKLSAPVVVSNKPDGGLQWKKKRSCSEASATNALMATSYESISKWASRRNVQLTMFSLVG